MVGLAERGLIPDGLIALGIRRLLRERLRDVRRGGPPAVDRLVDALRAGPIAVEVDRANHQHYELPPEFFRLVLGARLKYSCCHWGPGVDDLDAAEEAMLRLTCERAGVRDGMRVLDLGCGWGSLATWVARSYPGCRVTAVSNSAAQRGFIEADARRRGLKNLKAVTADVNRFTPVERYDRVLSVEMFEHVRNHERLLRHIASWLEPQGKLFVHLFCHRELAYLYEDRGAGDWMARHFFTGGMMPSLGLIERFRDDLAVQRRFEVDGRHYGKTLRAWLDKLDRGRNDALRILREVHGPRHARRWFGRWRIFFLACAELFEYDDGREWLVAHYLLARP